jgi:hypothetical protein
MPLKKSLAGVLVHAPRIERTWGSRPDFSPLDTGCPWRRATDPFPSPEGIHCLPRRADPQSSTFPSSTPWPGWGAEWTAATTPGQNLQLHCGSSSSPCWLHTLGRDAFILQVTGVFSLAFARGLHWRWTAAARIDLFHCAVRRWQQQWSRRAQEQIYSVAQRLFINYRAEIH